MSNYRDKSDLVIRRKGRFIKKDGLLFRSCKITEYDFDQLKKVETLTPDNPRGNIFFKKLHNEEDFQRALSKDNKIDDSLEEQKHALMMPRNFTDDWMEQKRRANRRTSKKNDDDYDEDDDEVEINQKKKEEPIQVVKENIIDNVLQTVDDENDLSLEDNDHHHKEIYNEKKQNESHEDFEKKIKDINQKIEFFESEKQKWMEQKKEWENVFDQEKKELKEKDKRISDIEKTLIDLKSDLSKKKKDILHKAKSHFETLVKAMSHAVLGDEFQKNPSKLEKFIERAIHESIGDDEFKIFGSQELKKILTNHGSSFIGDLMAVDAHLDGLNFRIESSHGILDTGLAVIIEDLLKKVNIDDLFHEDEEKE